ncbi:MAG: PAS domain S-box protein [Nostoc sp.]|uniref:PAS domain-containing protein n=1 Tax=Nostoc sp. TaxID=1180 RepID=UPI002FEF62D4
MPIGDREVWFEASISPMSEDTVVCVARDISDVYNELLLRKAAEAALIQQEARYRNIFETVNDGISVIDLETGKVVAANPAFYQMHGYSQAEFLQLIPTDFIHPDYFHIFGKFIKSIKKGDEFHTQAVDIRKDGTYLDIEVTGKLLNYNGKQGKRISNPIDTVVLGFTQSTNKFKITTLSQGVGLTFSYLCD